ncbi:alpha/beta hydrolase [Saccharopolyspora erythraea]|uniref:alpha/beta hydrolase family protein n=1 Tax=Saccharopolyspora erythraea TaxID=1836 RepID=UPI001BA9A465|nr:alpha/beta hydrolase [Saccharopolyspora erythraea]QUH05446.1 alpha/beta hydrolase [Saccharopolyspora erythraea]
MRRTLGAIAAASVALLVLTPNAAAARDTAKLALPEPSGPHAVGTTALHLRDDARPDPWVPEERRELMVSLWYPSESRHGPRAAYVTPTESELILESAGVTGVPGEVLSTTRTHARVGVRPVDGEFPLVVLSPGFSLPRTSLTGLAEDLASRGYAVAAIDHTYEASAITFPDGRVTGCLLCGADPDGEVVAGSRAADISFVLDRLTGEDPLWSRKIDADRIAMVGHSMGGAGAARVMLTDPRVRAGINMDGTFHPALDTDLGRPCMMLGSDQHGRPGADESWDGTWPNLTGWKRWLSVAGAAHSSFTDYSLLGEQMGAELEDEPIRGERAARITRLYVAAFLDIHLRGRERPLLDGPSPRFPEVRFEK